MKKLFIAIPCYDGSVPFQMAIGLVESVRLLGLAGIQTHIEFHPGCCYIQAARNVLVNKFLKSDATDLLFIDSDMGFKAEGMLKIMQSEQDITAGVYPFKMDIEDYPVKVITNPDGTPVQIPGTTLIELEGAATGFMRIKRSVFEKWLTVYPDQIIRSLNPDGTIREEYHNFFDCEYDNHTWWGEDYNFCRKWKAMGGKIYGEADIDFLHIGKKAWSGNYAQHLYRRPGGKLPVKDQP